MRSTSRSAWEFRHTSSSFHEPSNLPPGFGVRRRSLRSRRFWPRHTADEKQSGPGKAVTPQTPSPHCYELCQERRGAFCVFLSSLLLEVLLFFLSYRFRVLKRFPGAARAFGRCSSCYPCTASKGRHQLTHAVTAKETSAPNLQIGSLPTQVRFRVRAVSNRLGWPHSWIGLVSFSRQTRATGPPSSNPVLPV